MISILLTYFVIAVIAIEVIVVAYIVFSAFFSVVIDLLNGLRYALEWLTERLLDIKEELEYRERKKQSEKDRLEYYKDHPEDMCENRGIKNE